MPVPIAVAILPPSINPEPEAPNMIEGLRDIKGTLASLIPAGQTIVILMRPDRYVATAADAASLVSMADETRALIARTFAVEAFGTSRTGLGVQAAAMNASTAARISNGVPNTRLSTPGGNPASWKARANCTAPAGVSSEALR